MAKRTRRALRKENRAVENKLGLFKVPPGTCDLDLIAYSDKAVKKYVAHFEKYNWTLESRPKVRRIKMWESNYRVFTDQRGDKIATPTDKGMRDDHPWYEPDADQYQVTADWSQPHRTATLEVPDATLTKLVEKELLPAGTEVH